MSTKLDFTLTSPKGFKVETFSPQSASQPSPQPLSSQKDSMISAQATNFDFDLSVPGKVFHFFWDLLPAYYVDERGKEIPVPRPLWKKVLGYILLVPAYPAIEIFCFLERKGHIKYHVE